MLYSPFTSAHVYVFALYYNLHVNTALSCTYTPNYIHTYFQEQ